MKEILIEIDRLAEEELERANKIHPLFASDHEGYAVIREEIEEAIESLEMMGKSFEEAWHEIKEDDEEEAQERVQYVRQFAEHSAFELIQVIAMCDKFIKSQEARDEGRENV